MTFQVQRLAFDEAVQSLKKYSVQRSFTVPQNVVKLKRRSRITNTVTKKWFDKECRLKRHAVRKLANAKTSRSDQHWTFVSYFIKDLKEYQLLIKSKTKLYLSTYLSIYLSIYLSLFFIYVASFLQIIIYIYQLFREVGPHSSGGMWVSANKHTPDEWGPTSRNRSCRVNVATAFIL